MDLKANRVVALQMGLRCHRLRVAPDWMWNLRSKVPIASLAVQAIALRRSQQAEKGDKNARIRITSDQ